MELLRLSRLAWAAWVLVAIPALPQAADSSGLDPSHSEMRPLVERFAADRAILNRTYNLDLSATTQERRRQFYADWTGRLAQVNFDPMSQDGKIDYILFENLLRHELRKLDLDAKAEAEAAAYLPFAQTIISLEETRRKMEPVNSERAAETLTGLPRQMDDARRTIDAQMASHNDPDAVRNRKVIANRAANEASALRNTLRSWFRFYDGYDPAFSWWNEEAYTKADLALDNYIKYLREKVAGLPAAPEDNAGAAANSRREEGRVPAGARAGDTADIVGSPIGREGLMNELAYEMIPYTPEELIAIAEKEFVWCEAEMKKASREMGFGDDWKGALEKVKGMHVEPGRQPQMVRDLEREAEKFMDDHNLITIPPLARETWRMEMMSPERQLVAPFFLGGEVMIVSYPTNTMTYEQKMMSMRGNNIPMSRATVFHELIPGHHLQGFMADRYRKYRSAFGGTPFITEGWALYWELLLWDMKFQKTPGDRVGALEWRMHRCARIIFSLSFHLGKMTPDECIRLLIDRVGFEPENAAGEVRRSFTGEYGPLYQAAYLLGGMQLYSLHKELVDSGKMTNREFHDAVLKQNRIPVEMIKASLTDQRLTKDYTTTWKFYGSVK
jgi:uncharacterized protein (DUF885 family)